MMLEEVSVVVSTYTSDRLNDVLACVDSLRRQTLPPKEIILALDPDDDLERFYRSRMPTDVSIVISEGFGLSNARNAGVRNARSSIVAFIDDDAIADKDWLRNLVQNYSDPHIEGVGGKIEPIWEAGCPIWFPEELGWAYGCSYKGLPQRRASVRNSIGANMSFRKDVFERIGYFNGRIGRIGTELLAGEEADLSLRILEGIPESRIVYDPSAIVHHVVHGNRTNLKFLLKVCFYQGLSKASICNDSPNRSRALSTETGYLRYLFKAAIPSRLSRFGRLESICQLLTLLLTTSSVLIGYFVGRSIDRSRS